MGLDKIFGAAGTALAAQTVRLNTVASNLTNVDTVASAPEAAYRPRVPVFQSVLRSTEGGVDGVRVADVRQSEVLPTPRYAPAHPLANEDGYIFESGVNVIEEMANMTDASRSYQTNIELVSTAKRLLLATLRLGQ